MEPPIKDTPNKGHLCTNLYSGNTFLPLKEKNLYNGQNDPSHYLEVPLHMFSLITLGAGG